MTEIHDAADALEESERLLAFTRDGQDHSAGLWKSMSVAPLAAIILAVAHTKNGQVDLAAVREVASRPSVGPVNGELPDWAWAANACPNRMLAETLERTASMDARQRDSIKNVMLNATAVAQAGVNGSGPSVRVSLSDFGGPQVGVILGRTGSGKSLLAQRLGQAWHTFGARIVVCAGKPDSWPNTYEQIAPAQLAEFVNALADNETTPAGIVLVLDDIVDMWSDLVKLPPPKLRRLDSENVHVLITSQKQPLQWDALAESWELSTALRIDVDKPGTLTVSRSGAPAETVIVDGSEDGNAIADL